MQLRGPWILAATTFTMIANLFFTDFLIFSGLSEFVKSLKLSI